MAGKAECVVEREDQTVIRSPSTVGVVPSVVRLHRYVPLPPPSTGPVTRLGILRRDGRRCAYCGASGETVDHVVPRSRGGSHSWENCVACCLRCNRRKADRLLAELGWTLPFVPGPPGRRVRSGWIGQERDPAWEPWLAPVA
ncbi:HNH endonuclease [Nakamurella sp. YIM 132084]|uniref:HNH endonuclease n=2 Tax=Nakamurella leprariae TaxID=2803911 RepID=A0A938YFF3_9ACTN|nr:HNH endonuclease [Nakamurella leprariae]